MTNVAGEYPMSNSSTEHTIHINIYTVFKSLCNNLIEHDALHIPAIDDTRRAAVAAIIRWHKPDHVKAEKQKIISVEAFFQQQWLYEGGRAEILFMQRTKRAGDR